MNRDDFLYELMGGMDDDLVLDTAVIKRAKTIRRNIILGVIAGILLLLYLNFYEVWQINRFTDMFLDKEPGWIQDGVYYTYSREGILRCEPGGEPQVLVSSKDRPIDGIYRQWGVNGEGVYYADGTTLWRMDPDTREETVLYQLDSHPDDPEAPRLTLSAVTEGEIVLIRWEDPVATEIHLDAATGEPTGEETTWPEDLWPMGYQAGDRVLWSISSPYPEGYHYPGWEAGPDGPDRMLDLWENGVSLLPEHTTGDLFSQLNGSVLLGCYTWQPAREGVREIDRYEYLLITEDGAYPLPDEYQDSWVSYLGEADGWLWFVSPQFYGRNEKCLWVRNLETGEDRFMGERFFVDTLATDGEYLFAKKDGQLTCWHIETDANGDPIAVTQVENTP